MTEKLLKLNNVVIYSPEPQDGLMELNVPKRPADNAGSQNKFYFFDASVIQDPAFFRDIYKLWKQGKTCIAGVTILFFNFLFSKKPDFI